jgi:stage II sporulation protein D
MTAWSPVPTMPPMPNRHFRSRMALVGALAIASLSLADAGPAPADTTRATAAGIVVPDHATLTIHGRGYGHGHGMSQYGAEGAARKGLSATKIAEFYYPHTRGGHTRGKVRVLITADTDDSTTVVNRAGLQVHDLGSGATKTLPTAGAAGRASQWRLSPGSGGKTKVSYRNGGWRVWTKLTGDGEFRAAKPITLVLGSGRITYRGWLQSRTPVGARGSHRVTVNKVSLEGYVRGVIPREMPALWHQAALRAQAIAARTYAAEEASRSTNLRWNLCDTSSCQVYGGKSAEYPSTNEATAKTAGRIRTYHGKPAFTQFSSSNGGWLAAGGQPYLVAKHDPYDGWSGNPNHTWTTHVSARAVENAFPWLGNLTGITVKDRDGNGKWNGRVVAMTLHGSKDTRSITGDTLRAALALRSLWIQITVG